MIDLSEQGLERLEQAAREASVTVSLYSEANPHQEGERLARKLVAEGWAAGFSPENRLLLDLIAVLRRARADLQEARELLEKAQGYFVDDALDQQIDYFLSRTAPKEEHDE